MKENIISIYGRVAIGKKWCSDCNCYAFFIGGILMCCGKKDSWDIERKTRLKRETQGTGRRGHISTKIKASILEKQNNKCAYCQCDLSQETIHFDHFIPFSYTFTGAREGDLVAACASCNLMKSNKMFDSKQEVRRYIKRGREAKK